MTKIHMTTPMENFKVKFWGTRGSIPSPLTAGQVLEKFAKGLMYAQEHGIAIPKFNPGPEGLLSIKNWLHKELPFALHGTYGGNTTCVEIQCGGTLFIFDLGTGVRELGNAHFGDAFANKGLSAIVLQSHLHWDHVQGFPFLGEIYLPLSKFPNNQLQFYGGMDWNKTLETILRGQMNPPVFPVDFRELERTSIKTSFDTVFDGRVMHISDAKSQKTIKITCGKLNHPQETYGYRIEFDGKVVALCTDHEPFGMGALHRPLLTLADQADVFVTECQYTHDDYVGAGGKVQKIGWGHSTPEYIAAVAREAKVKATYTMHHDPASSDEKIEAIAQTIALESRLVCHPAWEGLEVVL